MVKRSERMNKNGFHFKAQCNSINQCHAEAQCHFEAQCHAGLDPASFPQKELLENDTGPLNQVQCRLPGVTKPERLESVYSLPRYAVTIMDRHFIY